MDRTDNTAGLACREHSGYEPVRITIWSAAAPKYCGTHGMLDAEDDDHSALRCPSRPCARHYSLFHVHH